MPNYQSKSDSISGEKIIAQARKISSPRVVNRTGDHKGQMIELKDNAFCIIDTPFKYKLEEKRS